MRIFVTGARGAIGQQLTDALVDAGHTVVAASRHPEHYDGAGKVVPFDLDGPLPGDRDAVGHLLASCDAAYYLIHALDRRDFEAIDRRRAERFADLWGPDRRVVYLGGLGADEGASPHLRSRHEVGRILRRRCDTVELRASIVLGPGSMSFRLVRTLSSLASRWPLPLLVPRAAHTATQPIAQRDLTTALVDALDLAAGVYDVGGPDIVTFAELLERSAAAQGRSLQVRPRLWIGPEWAGPGAALLADVDPRATTALFGSMATRTVVRPDHALPRQRRPTTGIDAALKHALLASA
jgi:uncharacterized protein YbjT (DUF2867 family)